MARLPAKPSRPTHGASLKRSYDALEDTLGQVRHTLQIFKDQTSRGNVPLSHAMDRLLEPLKVCEVRLEGMRTTLISTGFRDYLRAATGDATQNPALDVPNLIAELRTAMGVIRTALPDLFDVDGVMRVPVVQDDTGRPVSSGTITGAQARTIIAGLDKVLARIAE